MDYSAIITSPIGPLGLRTTETHLVGIDFLAKTATTKKPSSPIAKAVVAQLAAYFKDPRHLFDLPLKLEVSDFQKRVLKALQKMPCGSTQHYGELAKTLKTSARPIGMACRRNPIPIVIPCHRITAKAGLGGYSGETTGEKIAIKTWLLQHENV